MHYLRYIYIIVRLHHAWILMTVEMHKLNAPWPKNDAL